MPRRMIITFALLVPLTALALDFSVTTLPYTDVRRGSPEAAGISLLTAEGVLEGNPDGTFRPRTPVNRAEFTKIAVELRYRFKPDDSLPILHLPCFPDVPKDSWFELPVCRAKAWGIVRGNAREGVSPEHWLFAPERTVNYVEALKILSEVYEVPLPRPNVGENEDWYGPYWRAAEERGTLLPVSIDRDSPLTRGQVARLAAAFLADSQGKLTEYRDSERSQYLLRHSSSSHVSSAASSASSVSSEASSSSSVSSSAPLFTLPAESHFLILGTRSDAIADIAIPPLDEPSSIRAAEITLYNEVGSVDNIELLTDEGRLIGTLRKRTTNDVTNYKQIYEMQLGLEQDHEIPANTEEHVLARAVVRGLNDNGASDQLLHILSFKITLHADRSNNTITVVLPAPFKRHQTAFGSITEVKRIGPETGVLSTSTGKLVGAFSFDASAIAGKQILLENLLFSVSQSGPVTVSNWYLTIPGSTWKHPCSVSSNVTGTTVGCNSLPAGLGRIGPDPLSLELHADIVHTLPGAGMLQVLLDASGSPADLGSVQWTDESGHFRWVDLPSPVAEGIILRN